MPPSWSPPWTPFRACWRSADAVVTDLILVEADGKWQLLVDSNIIGRSLKSRGIGDVRLDLQCKIWEISTFYIPWEGPEITPFNEGIRGDLARKHQNLLKFDTGWLHLARGNNGRCFHGTELPNESSSFAPFLLAHFCSPLNLKEPNYRNETTRQFNSWLMLSWMYTMPCLTCWLFFLD